MAYKTASANQQRRKTSPGIYMGPKLDFDRTLDDIARDILGFTIHCAICDRTRQFFVDELKEEFGAAAIFKSVYNEFKYRRECSGCHNIEKRIQILKG